MPEPCASAGDASAGTELRATIAPAVAALRRRTGAKCSLWPKAVRLRRARRAPRPVCRAAMPRTAPSPLRPPRAAPRRAPCARAHRHLRHARGRRAGPRRNRGRRAGRRGRIPRPARRLFSAIASVSVGKPAIRSAPIAMSGRRRARRRRRRATASARLWRRFMRLRIRSSPACRLRCRCGISRGSSAISRTGRRRSRRGRARTGAGAAGRAQRQQARDQLAERRAARQVGAVGGEVDAGQHDLGDAALDQRAHLRDDTPTGTLRFGAAAIGDDAEGAAMVAAVLHLDEGARALGEAGDADAAPSRAPP